MDILLKLYKRLDIEELLTSIPSFYPTKIYVHVDYSDNETIDKLINILSKTLKLPYKVFISETNLGCSGAHKNALKWVYSFSQVDEVLIIEDDLKLIKYPSFCYESHELYVLSNYYWSFILDRSTYNWLESINLEDLPLSQIDRDLLSKMKSQNISLIWDAEMELKIKYSSFNLPINREICFENIGVPSTRNSETPIFVTYKNGIKIS